MLHLHREHHKSHRRGWLRAAVLGANDGIISTASLVMGVAATGANARTIAIVGIASLVAGAMSMAAGEYVSVSSQADTERADLTLEQHELMYNAEHEMNELIHIYKARGLEDALAHQVAQQLMRHDALGSHARDELGITASLSARPLEAAWASAATFACGSALPLLSGLLLPSATLLWTLPATTLVFLGALGGLSAYMGGAQIVPAVGRIGFWGALAMGISALVGKLFNLQV